MVASRDSQVRLGNLALRMASLVGKFGLSLFVARFLDLAELGVYGIVFALSMFMVVLLGGRIDYDLARRIILLPKDDAAILLRDQTVFYLLNFLVALPLFIIAGLSNIAGFALPIAFCAWAICSLEGYANLLFVNTYSLGMPLLSNVVFFVRSGLWAFAAMLLLFLFPGLRTLWTVLLLWIMGSSLAIMFNLRILRVSAWPSLRRVPVQWHALRSGLKASFWIWIGSIGLAGGTYLDRVVLSAYVDLRAVGVATFYASFSNAVVTLVASSCLAVVLPRLMKVVDEKDWPVFWRELRGAGASIVFVGLFFCVTIAIAVPYSSYILKKPEMFSNRYTLWSLMAAAMLRILAEGVYIGLYVLRLDTAIWSGNIIFLAISIVLNLWLISLYGLIGLGIANIVISLFLLLFRSWRLIVFARENGAVK